MSNRNLLLGSTTKYGYPKIVVRAGVSQPYGTLVRAASDAGIPVLFSANAFAKTNSNGNFTGFNVIAAQNMPQDLDAALDSAGFVAAVVYGDYRWSVEQYYDLVTARNWAWHAAMDFCCEPPVAGAKVIRAMRLEATAWGYSKCVHEAARRGAPMPSRFCKVGCQKTICGAWNCCQSRNGQTLWGLAQCVAEM